MTEWHFYEPANGHGLAHDPLSAIVASRPIGWISSLSADGVRNLAPYSFFNLVNYRPPLIAFSSQGWKDSVANIAATRAFVRNLATVAQAEAMNASSAAVDADVDEFALAGLEPVASTLVAPRRVGGSPVAFECRLTQLIRLETRDGVALDQWLVIGEAVGVHIDRALIDDGVYQTARSCAAAARPIISRSTRVRCSGCIGQPEQPAAASRIARVMPPPPSAAPDRSCARRRRSRR